MKKEQYDLSAKENDRFRLHKKAVLLNNQGKNNVEIAKIMGVHRNSVSLWLRNYNEYKKSGLIPKKRGRKKWQNRTLNINQERRIQMFIINETPDNLKLGVALWTRKAVQKLIKIRFRVDMPIRTVGEYLMRWEFTSQKPFMKTYKAQSEEAKKWLDEEYPKILCKTKKESYKIYWGTSKEIIPDPILKKTPFTMISAITNQGEVNFMLFDHSTQENIYIMFLDLLIKDAPKKIFFIWEDLPATHLQVVNEWLKEHINKIEFFILPASPSGEKLNKSLSLKNGMKLYGNPNSQPKPR